jgi:hypothetical protein
MEDIKKALKAAYHFGRDNGEGRSDKNFNDFLETTIAKEALGISDEDVAVAESLWDEPPTEEILNILSETEDAYMRGDFRDEDWIRIAKFLLDVDGAHADGVAYILNSKHMRWSNDGGVNDYDSFINYVERGDYFNNGLFKDLLENSKVPY